MYPVFISGIEKTMPRGRHLPVPFNITLNTMPPLYGRDYLQDTRSQGRKKFTAALEHLFVEMGATIN